MTQFSLEKYLENPSRKVVTRDGRQVRIVCWDLKSNTPIIAAIQWNQEREDCYCYNTIGRCANNIGELDLFFADEEDELTEFDYAVLSIISDHNSHTDSIEDFAKRSSKKLLDLARKEIEKDFPKWKKATEYKEFEVHVCVMDEDMCMDEDTYTYLDTTVIEGEYYIELSDLKTLPKEE